jgi:hypothetical protein
MLPKDYRRDAIRLVIECNQRPLCLCPTVGENKSRATVWTKPGDSVKALKQAIQAQLNRGNSVNMELLDPVRQVLFDPIEGFELQDNMPHGYTEGTALRLKLRRLPPEPPAGKLPWTGAFEHAQTLARKQVPIPNRPIRDVRLETSIYKSGGTPEIAASFAARETARLQSFADIEGEAMRIPEREWRYIDTASQRPLHAYTAAAGTALVLMQNFRR